MLLLNDLIVLIQGKFLRLIVKSKGMTSCIQFMILHVCK